ncbi:hypothetical protein Godav_000150 [Gossypium davidsonii]|uniref:Uncharacterized protein n=1 Tax=Gossypium davidsonii TaxID=34287 RepID=A0A7J8T9V0_GOSDV|nr:hypothetical protein [Gossypium davidsonii]
MPWFADHRTEIQSSAVVVATAANLWLFIGPTARAKVAKADEKTPKSEGATETESIAHFYVVQTLG